jgi:hypothetical protein
LFTCPILCRGIATGDQALTCNPNIEEKVEGDKKRKASRGRQVSTKGAKQAKKRARNRGANIN